MTRSYWDRVLKARITRRRTLAAGGASALGSILLAACGGGGGSTTSLQDAKSSREPGAVWFAKNDWKLADETKDAVRGGIYRGYLTADQAGHYDAISMVSGNVPFSAHVHELLMARNRGPGIDPSSTAAAKPVGALAESWEISPDGLTITFTMRQGVKWHPIAPVNGRVMDIDDFKTSHERHLQMGFYRTSIGGLVNKVEFPDARRMVWKLNNPFAPIFDRIYHDKFAYPILPKELNANVALAESTAIGTGYKILDKHQPSIAMEFRKHAEYWDGDPFIDRWHQPIIPEYANRYAQFLNGNLTDFTPTAKDVLLLHQDAPGAVIVGEPIPENSGTRMRFGLISPEKQPWKDPRVRIAIRRSIDFKRIGEFLSNKVEFERNGIPIEVTSMTHLPQNPNYWLNPENGDLGKLSENYLYDATAARALTAAAGFKDPIPMSYYVLLEQGQIPEPDQLVVDSMVSSGVVKLDINRFNARAEHNRYRVDGDYDGMVPQSGSSDDADYFIFRDYHSEGNPAGRQAFPDPRIDALGIASRQELDLEKRYGILKDFQLFMAEWMATVPGRHLFTEFSFRWPWLRNNNYGTTSGNWVGSASPPEGRPVQGGHLQWLDPAMPNRDRRV